MMNNNPIGRGRGDLDNRNDAVNINNIPKMKEMVKGEWKEKKGIKALAIIIGEVR